MDKLPFIVVALLSMATSCAEDEAPCDLDAELRIRGGLSATDCGTVPVGGDSTAVDACVSNALEQGSPFFARYEQEGIDSNVALGVVRDAEGKLMHLQWDSDPSGGSDRGAVISGWVCGEAVASSPGPFLCGDAEDLGYVCQ